MRRSLKFHRLSGCVLACVAGGWLLAAAAAAGPGIAPLAETNGPPRDQPRQPARALMLATTTSVDATGLLDVLADAFKRDSGIALRWIAVGTGAALKQARDGNADVVIVHARKLEDEFLRDGFGVNRRVFARNYFMLVGPPGDPAGVAGAPSVAEALGRIRAKGAAFVSRGDKSGTHARELELWALAGGQPGAGYLETGQGMAETLRVAAERRAYTLTDSATFYASKGLEGLRLVFGDAPELENIYAVIAVDPVRVPAARYGEAMAFIAFLTSPRGQKIIGEFRGRAGRPLFEPLAGVAGVDLVK
ncbi:MAG: substrate-binding domain-containing protein [Acidobacteriota bacterium]